MAAWQAEPGHTSAGRMTQKCRLHHHYASNHLDELTAMVRRPGGGVKRWFRLREGLMSYVTSVEAL